MAERLRVPTALAEVSDLVPRIHIKWLTVAFMCREADVLLSLTACDTRDT